MGSVISKIEITPDTKVGALLDDYPELEDVLIEMAPVFKKLRNPVLRKTVAKITALRQVAQIGKLSLATMINKLRDKAGVDAALDVGEAAGVDSSAQPGWFKPALIAKTLDARVMLETGGHPVSDVISELSSFPAGKIYELITPFLPAPLIDQVQAKGYQAWSQEESTELIKTYFIKK